MIVPLETSGEVRLSSRLLSTTLDRLLGRVESLVGADWIEGVGLAVPVRGVSAGDGVDLRSKTDRSRTVELVGGLV